MQSRAKVMDTEWIFDFGQRTRFWRATAHKPLCKVFLEKSDFLNDSRDSIYIGFTLKKRNSNF